MLRRCVTFAGLTALLWSLGATDSQGGVNVVAETRHRRSLTAGGPSKLSATLLATKDSGGILRGANESGEPVIDVERPNLAGLRASAAVTGVSERAPASFQPVRRLKISYSAENKPTAADLEGLGLRLIEDYERGSFLIVEPLNRQIDAQLAGKLQESAKVQFATAVFRARAIPPTNLVAARTRAERGEPPTNDPRWEELWGMRNIRAPQAWKQVRETDVVVAVIDTGVDYNHEDLKDNMWTDAQGNHGFDFVENDADPMDENSHGTHCAGTVGAVGNNSTGVVGVAPKVKIMGVRWLDAGGFGDVIDAIRSIDFAVEHGAKVLSNSWFWTEDDPDLRAAIGRAEARGVLFVAAAANFQQFPNNNNGDNDQEGTLGRIPAAYPEENIIAVAAIDEGENLADFSNFGKTTVDLGAPGVLIMSTVPGNQYDGTFSGTSMATPHVAGAAALVLGKYSEASYKDVKGKLLGNARKIEILKERCVTGGTLDISFLGKDEGKKGDYGKEEDTKKGDYGKKDDGKKGGYDKKDDK